MTLHETAWDDVATIMTIAHQFMEEQSIGEAQATRMTNLVLEDLLDNASGPSEAFFALSMAFASYLSAALIVTGHETAEDRLRAVQEMKGSNHA